MPSEKNRREIERLIQAFEAEAAKFHDISFCTYLIQTGNHPDKRIFKLPAHRVMLWEYYGKIKSGDNTQMFENLKNSVTQQDLSMRTTQMSLHGIIEGPTSDLFIRMARRAGLLFSHNEAQTINAFVLNEIFEKSKDTDSNNIGNIGIANDDPLAIWLNYLLIFISQVKPSLERIVKVESDPYTLSLLALEHFSTNQTIGKSDQSSSKVQNIKFKVALSFPGERRAYVSKVADSLRTALGTDKIFYDFDYQSQLAVLDLDLLLQKIYRDNSELIVVFLCAEYAGKEWCGLEWRAIRDIIKSKDRERIIFVRFDNAKVEGILSIDGYIDAQIHDASKVASFVLERISTIGSSGGT